MGGPIGRHLLAAGTAVAAYDPDAEALGRLASLGAVACTSAGEVAAQAELVLVVVVDDVQAFDAVTACLPSARAGTVIAICASVRPDTCRQLARDGDAHGVHVIDAA